MRLIAGGSIRRVRSYVGQQAVSYILCRESVFDNKTLNIRTMVMSINTRRFARSYDKLYSMYEYSTLRYGLCTDSYYYH